jgi:hypothetical protein
MKQSCRDKQLDTDQKQEESADIIADLLGAGKSPACKPEGKRQRTPKNILIYGTLLYRRYQSMYA